MSENNTPANVGSMEGLGHDLAYYAEHTMTPGTPMQLAAAAAVAEMETLRAQVAHLSAEGVAYVACLSHRLHNYSMTMRAVVATPMRRVCPICAGLATNVSGPHFGD